MSEKFKRDRMDGTPKESTLKEVFLFPGRAILWIQYMFPGSTYRKVRMSSRHARSPIMTIIYSISFWFLVGYVIIMFIADLLS